MPTIQVADKPTLDTVNTNVSAVKTSTDKIGNTNDTGATSTAGTVLGKQNKIIGDIATVNTNVGTINTNVSSIKSATDNIGATNATGGSTTAGTLMAKSNKIITDVGTVSTNVSTVNTNIGTSSATASSSGTSLFALIKYIVTTVGAVDTNVNTVKSSTDRIGATDDAASGASATTGTLMAKTNKALNNQVTIDNHVNTVITDTTAIKTSTDKIGATGDTGGSASAGTVMGKENKIITDVTTVSTNIGTSSATASSSGTSLFALIKYLTSWATSARGTKIDNIGATGDTGGSASAGTVMGKENKIITDVGTVSTNVSTVNTNIGTSSATASASGSSLFALIKYLTGWATSARGTKIDNIGATTDTGGGTNAGTVMAKLNEAIGKCASIYANQGNIASDIDTITDKIGATGDIGGTSSAGTVMGKENKIITDIGTVLDRVTTARGTKIDNIGATGDTGGSATAGTVMGKLNKVITDVGALDTAPSITHTVWQSSYKKFSSQYNISSTNTGSSATEKCYYYKIGSLSFTAANATDMHVNMVTTGMELNDTLSATNATVELYISTSNYSSGSTLANRTTIANNSIWSGSINLTATGATQEFVMIDNRDWVAGTTYYIYVCVHGTLNASTGQIKLKTPLIDFQCFFTTGETTTNTGLRKRIIARAKSIDSAYFTSGKHVYELESMVISDTNYKIYYPYRFSGGDSSYLIVPVIAGNYIRFLTTTSSLTSVWNNKAASAGYKFNAYVGPYVIIEEYY